MPCVLFDFDGTLIDTHRLYLESFRRSLSPHFNRLLSDAEILEHQPSAERRLLRQLVEEASLPGYFDSFLTHYRTLHDTHNDGLYPGVEEMLAHLRREGHLLGIVTGKSLAAWDVTFAKSGLTASAGRGHPLWRRPLVENGARAGSVPDSSRRYRDSRILYPSLHGRRSSRCRISHDRIHSIS